MTTQTDNITFGDYTALKAQNGMTLIREPSGITRVGFAGALTQPEAIKVVIGIMQIANVLGFEVWQRLYSAVENSPNLTPDEKAKMLSEFAYQAPQ